MRMATRTGTRTRGCRGEHRAPPPIAPHAPLLCGRWNTDSNEPPWSQPQKLVALERIARGCGLTSLVLNSVKLDNSHAPALAAAVRSHSSLEKLSLESTSLGEPALVALAVDAERDRRRVSCGS